MADRALAMPGVSVWAHPFDCSRMRPLVPILDEARTEELAALICLANEREVAIEINGGPAQHEDYRLATASFYELAREMNARFTATADAHHPDDFSRLELAFEWAHAMGFQDRDFLTTEELVDRQERKAI
jgi:histidinol phosphatase-like PHP family hydrolase